MDRKACDIIRIGLIAIACVVLVAYCGCAKPKESDELVGVMERLGAVAQKIESLTEQVRVNEEELARLGVERVSANDMVILKRDRAREFLMSKESMLETEARGLKAIALGSDSHASDAAFALMVLRRTLRMYGMRGDRTGECAYLVQFSNGRRGRLTNGFPRMFVAEWFGDELIGLLDNDQIAEDIVWGVGESGSYCGMPVPIIDTVSRYFNELRWK